MTEKFYIYCNEPLNDKQKQLNDTLKEQVDLILAEPADGRKIWIYGPRSNCRSHLIEDLWRAAYIRPVVCDQPPDQDDGYLVVHVPPVQYKWPYRRI
jgi:hypothetical protein